MIPYFSSKKYTDTIKRIENAFNFKNNKIEEVPLIIQTVNASATGNNYESFPKDYFDNPKSMLDYQVKKNEEHLEKVDDDYVPFLNPWYGVCVIPDYFGSKIIFPKEGDPAASSSINSIYDIKKIELKEFTEADLTKRVIDTMKYFKHNSEYPVSVTDSQSPLDCMTQIVGYLNFFYWMKDKPEVINNFLDIICNTLKDWVKYQKKIIAEKDSCSNGIVNIKPPEGVGIWFSDDDLTILSPELYGKFLVDKYSELFSNFGEVIIHWCGNGNHQLDNVVSINNLKGVHNFFLGNIEALKILQKKLKKYRKVLIAGDYVPVDEQLSEYLKLIKENLDPEGLVLQFNVSPKLGLKDGVYVETDRDVIETAKKIINFFRG